MPSVLQAWVMDLPLRAQGTLLTAVRGCDLTPKLPLDAIERRLVACIRYAFMIPADPREVDREPGTFMSAHVPMHWKASELGHYPLHWVAHLMHAAEVIAYRHPDAATRAKFTYVYVKLVSSLHLDIETAEAFARRMDEDRIASGEIVS